MTEEGVFEVGDTLIDNNIKLVAVRADIDGSGCYVCDDGKNQCYFINKDKCPKCHSSEFIHIDFVGPRVIFIPKHD